MSSGFVANASSSRPDRDVSSDPFWPVVRVDALRATVRLAGDVTAERLRAAVVAAVIAVNMELSAWCRQMLDAGYEQLHQVPAPVVDGQSQLVALYLRAVQCAVALEIGERYRSSDATAQGGQRAEDMTPTLEDLRRDVRYAISDLLGTRRVTVELI